MARPIKKYDKGGEVSARKKRRRARKDGTAPEKMTAKKATAKSLEKGLRKVGRRRLEKDLNEAGKKLGRPEMANELAILNPKAYDRGVRKSAGLGPKSGYMTGEQKDQLDQRRRRNPYKMRKQEMKK